MLVPALLAASIGGEQTAVPRRVLQVDTHALQGTPSQLAWSEDGSQLYLQSAEYDANGAVKKTHSFLIVLDSPGLRPVDAAPSWATRYWSWKSYKTPPDMNSPEILVSRERRTRMATNSAMGSSINEPGGFQDVANGSGTSVSAVANRADQQVKVEAVILKLQGDVVGEFVGTPPTPGLTFGWAPSAPPRLAYANTAGHLAILDARGRKHDVASTKGVSLPAWSVDGSKIAFISMAGKSQYDVCVVEAR
jgi:hypothetical protein